MADEEKNLGRMARFLGSWGDALALAGLVVIILIALLDARLGNHLHRLLIASALLVFFFAALVTIVSLASACLSLKQWGAPVVMIALLSWFAWRWICPVAAEEAPVGSNPSCAALVPIMVALVLTSILVVWFVTVFSRKVTPGPVAKEREIIPMIRFCYVFMIVSFLLSLAPAFAVLFTTPSFYIAMVRSPVGVVKGCVHYPKDPDWELACSGNDPYKAQWMLNIGGSVRFREPVPAASPVAAASPSKAIAASPANVSDDPAAPTPTPTPGPTPSVVDTSIRSDPFRPTVVVHGGLAVPWYFLTLAIVGAAVSLARRVPEYQRRATSAEDTLNGAKTREYLEFQILQVVSAPLIALAAYNLVAPTSISTSAALGFSSGFSSEAILLAIRSLTDSVTKTPQETPTPDRDDAAVAAAVKSALLRDTELLDKEPDLKVNQIQVKVENGVVTLSGTLASDEAVARAGQVARTVAGVKEIKNELKKA